ncbi:MAG: (2Fe-2S) ferredoxin domain-containing protein [Clostridium sp.]|uniref:(2Fe-2S) ferredoxin domain-containing protein n=1 Tax=Clostridium sp. TaxID=1506 RepID=UPI0039EB6D31
MRRKPKYHVLICNGTKCNKIQDGVCYQKGSEDIISKFDELINEYGMSDEVLVSSCGCFRNGITNKGPNMVIYPEGTWYSGIKVEDVEEIIKTHLKSGKKIERLLSK